MCYYLYLKGTIPRIQKDQVAKRLHFMPGFLVVKIYQDPNDEEDEDEEEEDLFFLMSHPCVLYREHDNNDDDDDGPGMGAVAGVQVQQPIMVY